MASEWDDRANAEMVSDVLCCVSAWVWGGDQVACAAVLCVVIHLQRNRWAWMLFHVRPGEYSCCDIQAIGVEAALLYLVLHALML